MTRGTRIRPAAALVLMLAACGESPPAAPAAGSPLDALLAPAGPPYALELSGPQWALWLDGRAEWEDDALFLPGVDLAELPIHEPTGGWSQLSSGPEALAVSVPGTVEQYLWGTLSEMRREGGAAPPDEPSLDGDFTGVSWWYRGFDVPAGWLQAVPEAEGAPRLGLPVAELQFEAVRLRAEVFLNETLVGYDAVGNTPFAMDVTRALRAGRNTLAVRVTDPGGNFSWEDFDAQPWGRHTLPASHGFGGVTGPVRLLVRAPLHVADVYVSNGPEPSRVEVQTTVRNATGAAITGALRLQLLPDAGEPAPGAPRFELWSVARPFPPGESVHSESIALPGVALWSPESPALHRVRVSLHVGPGPVTLKTGGGAGTGAGADGDGAAGATREGDFGAAVDVREQRFGFRSFTLEGLGDDAVFKLNGRRIVLRSAISWGFWPASGLVPLPGLARRQVEDARALGLNMLNHHRTIAAPGLLDAQDELGLLAYCEPGGYTAHGGDELCRALAREKLLRLVKRDRSRPSVVIWNLINEETAEPTEAQRRDLADAHALDPSRVMTFTSGWAKDGDDPLKLHARPLDATLYTSGWWDSHNAPGPGVWRDEFWKGPADHLRRSENRSEIVFWGEEGAIAAPPRLAAIAPRVDPAEPGWDGADYLAWRDAIQRWLDAKGWTAAGLDLDSVTTGLGGVAYDYQARAIENVRLGDVADGYVINGWEDSKLENHSGVVDVWRNLKGDPALLQRANAPTALVVRLRASVASASEWVTPSLQTATGVIADIGLIDESGLEGPHTLVLELRDAEDRAVWSKTLEAPLEGGAYGRMLAEGLSATFEGEAGRYRLSAELRAGGEDGAPVASGGDGLL
ncbi:MAG TPA: glycoside hydrolase family 2 TIM barrel-domain containing protein, partial [Planctomycetota bacterium]|nr:glycoside hydrolase family 2 TIM barrel-domain containing protein [Planctomycetota bacterium]